MPHSSGRIAGDSKVRSPANTRVIYPPNGTTSAVSSRQYRMICTQPFVVMGWPSLEPLWPEQGEDEISHQHGGRDSAEDVVDGHRLRARRRRLRTACSRPGAGYR